MIYPNNSIGGEHLQEDLFANLEKRFDPCPASLDDYIFHMTVAIGKAAYENYERAYDLLGKRSYNRSYKFYKITRT